jgi:hypothetical protein
MMSWTGLQQWVQARFKGLAVHEPLDIDASSYLWKEIPVLDPPSTAVIKFPVQKCDQTTHEAELLKTSNDIGRIRLLGCWPGIVFLLESAD